MTKGVLAWVSEGCQVSRHEKGRCFGGANLVMSRAGKGGWWDWEWCILETSFWSRCCLMDADWVMFFWLWCNWLCEGWGFVLVSLVLQWAGRWGKGEHSRQGCLELSKSKECKSWVFFECHKPLLGQLVHLILWTRRLWKLCQGRSQNCYHFAMPSSALPRSLLGG